MRQDVGHRTDTPQNVSPTGTIERRTYFRSDDVKVTDVDNMAIVVIWLFGYDCGT